MFCILILIINITIYMFSILHKYYILGFHYIKN